MRRLAVAIAMYLLLGACLNLAVAWSLVAVHGKSPFEWRPHHNPRSGDPIVFFAIRRTGVEWVLGCARPGTLIGRHPDSVVHYSGIPWWPPEAVTFDVRQLGVAAGWPLLGFSSWRTVDVIPLPGDSVDYRPTHHWGFLLVDTKKGGWQELPAVMPFRPIWTGFIVNTILYAMFLGAAIKGWTYLNRRRRFSRGLCIRCAYPVRGFETCPECGSASTPPLPRKSSSPSAIKQAVHSTPATSH